MTDPIDETQPHVPGVSPPPASQSDAGEPAALSDAGEPAVLPPPAASSLRVDPDRPKATDWREPAWFPPRDKDRGPSLAALVTGVVLVVIGLYFFLDRTLGVALPRIQWSTVWPVILIAIGAIVLVRSVSRRS